MKDVPTSHPVFPSIKVLDMIRGRSRGAKFPGHAVRHLLLLQHDYERIPVLSAYPLVQNLCINPAPEHGDVFPQIEGLPLKRLYCNLTSIFGEHRTLDFTNSMFSHLTHLEIFDNVWYEREPEAFKGVALIPNLTHLGFHDHDVRSVWMYLLRECSKLRVFIVPTLENAGVDREALINDLRVVEFYTASSTRDWINGAHSGADNWSRAEEFIAKRKSGVIEGAWY